MARKMLIDAVHPEETRVAISEDGRLEEFDFEASSKAQIRNNIYLGKIIKVEPSLQAAFVDYGGGRQGFLSFAEIHPDYYQIPVDDREEIMRQMAQELPENDSETDHSESTDTSDNEGDVEDSTGGRPKFARRYKIQEVIKNRQIVLVQIVREERGHKGASLSTYLSLAGRYCVLMPNAYRSSGGVSRKITSEAQRQRLKKILQDLQVPEGMSVVIRTAGTDRKKAEIKKDYDYLIRLWNEIREDTLKSIAPALVHEEANIIKRAIRDMYTRDIQDIVVEGEEGYKTAKNFIKNLMPSHARRVQLYKDNTLPLFQKETIEDQITDIYQPQVTLPSGGSIVLNTTEALVAIDVNSGRSARTRHITETALKTNLEAADEIARQLRLRDLGGLVVVDFIDMNDPRRNGQVERRLRDALKRDRARIQVGRISSFGLLELSRQRLRTNIIEANATQCTSCKGSGYVRSVESTVLAVLRKIEGIGLGNEASALRVSLPQRVAFYLLNQKRASLVDVEKRYNLNVVVAIDEDLPPSAFHIEITDAVLSKENTITPAVTIETLPAEKQIEVKEETTPKEIPVSKENLGLSENNRRRNRRRRRGTGEGKSPSRNENQPSGLAAASLSEAPTPLEKKESAMQTEIPSVKETQSSRKNTRPSKPKKKMFSLAGERTVHVPAREETKPVEEAIRNIESSELDLNNKKADSLPTSSKKQSKTPTKRSRKSDSQKVAQSAPQVIKTQEESSALSSEEKVKGRARKNSKVPKEKVSSKSPESFKVKESESAPSQSISQSAVESASSSLAGGADLSEAHSLKAPKKGWWKRLLKE